MVELRLGEAVITGAPYILINLFLHRVSASSKMYQNVIFLKHFLVVTHAKRMAWHRNMKGKNVKRSRCHSDFTCTKAYLLSLAIFNTAEATVETSRPLSVIDNTERATQK